jgi:hypothetical protein
MQQPQLWTKISSFQMDDPSSAFTFTERLARENGWSLSYSLAIVEEYKKFIYLLCISIHPLTPSDQVDQVWHLHLIYTHSYWVDFCKNTLSRDLHHGPTKGGQQEKDKFTNWYQCTKELYTKEFGHPPPADCWPPDNIRFGHINFQRINMDSNWVIKKPFILKKK